MEEFQLLVQNIVLDATKRKFAEIPNGDLALSCQAYAEQIVPEMVQQLFDGQGDISVLRDITSQHAKKELARVVTKFGTSVMLRVSKNLSDGSMKQLLNDEIIDTLQTGWETYLDGGNWQQAVEKRAKVFASGYVKKISCQAFNKARNYFPENNYYMAFCDDAKDVANNIVEAVEKGETIESICASAQEEIKSSLIQHGTDYANEKFGQGIDAAINFAADNMREKGRGKRHSAYNKKVDWAADTIKEGLKSNSGDAIKRLLNGDDAGAVVGDFAKETARNVVQESVNKYAGEYISDSVNNVAKYLKVTGKGSRKINRRINDAGGIVSESLTNNVTANVADVLAGNKDFDTAVKDIATETAKQSAQTYMKEHGAELAKEAVQVITEKAAKQFKDKATKDVITSVGGKLANADAITGVAGTVYDIGKSFKAFMDGEITKAELLRDLGEKGSAACVSSVYATIGGTLGAVGGPAGVAIGSAVGSMVGYVANSMLYGAVLEQFEREEAAKKNAEAVHAFCEEAIRQMRIERVQFEQQIQELLQERADACMRGFRVMDEAILSSDFDKFSCGLNEIAQSFGRELQFTNFEEFDKFMESDEDFVL